MSPNHTSFACSSHVEARREIAGLGSLSVAAENGGEGHLLWSQRGDVRSALLRGEGEIAALDFAFDGNTLWLAWTSVLDGGEEGSVSVAGLSIPLEITHPPRVLRRFEGGLTESAQPLRVRARESGGAAVAALAGHDEPCVGLFEPRTQCRRLHVELIDADGSTRRVAVRTLDGGDPAVDDLVILGPSVVAAFHVWHGGPLLDLSLTATDPRTIGRCRPANTHRSISPRSRER